MAFQGYKQNPLYKSMTETAYGLAKTLPSRRNKAVDVSRFSSIPAAVKRTGVTPTATTPASLKGLGTITTPYGGQTRFEQFHPGVDIANVSGTRVPSFQGGTVSSVQTPAQSGGFGTSVIVTDAQGNKWRYSHLNRSYVKANQEISAGSVIGEIGTTGNVYSMTGGSGSHLDLRIQNSYGKYVNPSTLF